jgi:hypothetical protein
MNLKFFKEPKEEPFGKHPNMQDPDGKTDICNRKINATPELGCDLIGYFGTVK